MQRMITYAEQKSGIDNRHVDVIQTIINSYITNNYFPWLFIVLFLNRKTIRQPINYILIGYYFLSATSEAFHETRNLSERKPGLITPFTTTYWNLSYGVYYILWFTAEIIGDWYMVLRTKAVACGDTRKLNTIYIICFAYNLVKGYVLVLCIHTFQNPLDLTDKTNERYANGNMKTTDLQTFNLYWWGVIVLIQVCSIIFDISIFFALKNTLFKKIKDCRRRNKGSFIEVFKHISELRIIISLTGSFILLPFIFFQTIKNFNEVLNGKNPTSENLNEKMIHFRSLAVNINYTFMYVDQILLKLYFQKKKFHPSKNSNPKNNSRSNLCLLNQLQTITTMGSTTNTSNNESSLNSQKTLISYNKLSSQPSYFDFSKGDVYGLSSIPSSHASSVSSFLPHNESYPKKKNSSSTRKKRYKLRDRHSKISIDIHSKNSNTSYNDTLYY